VVQSLPFVAAVLLAGLEGSRLNDLALWRRMQAKLAWLPGKAAIVEAPIAADKRIEPVQ
jgi:hypothetical protein